MLFLLLPASTAGAQAAAPAPRVEHLFDPAQSRFGFEIRTRFGQRIEGFFPRFEGSVEILPDGRHQVHLRVFSAYVEIPGKPRYTAWMRGEDFFDVARYPELSFDSQPFAPGVLNSGGAVVGTLNIRGISHQETLTLMPAGCARAGYDCDAISRGTVLRGRYGMDKWDLALSDRVTFVLRARLTGAAAP
ncbi:YceI family protein [Xanthomonas sp. AmX2]|uniref:YceI family protein n=1 Tax=Xanthomonas sp. TaxID=29446 RepID=UPI0019815442|nr:YceI family protein [Xanthomonas sp.]MBN6150673.1 YceI family protein [Xanthomonas sp.]